MKMKMGYVDDLPTGPPSLCEFRGLEHKDKDPRNPDYGDGWIWRFEAVDGPHKGKTGTRVTGKQATVKSACGKFLAMLVGRPVGANEEIDLDAFVGKRYLVHMEAREGGGTRVSSFYGADAAAPPGVANRAAPPPPPPPRQPPPQRYWILLTPGAEPTLETRADIEQWFVETKADPAMVDLCPEGGSQWKPASDFGFQGSDLAY